MRNRDLDISFDFAVGEIKFRPKVVIKNVSEADIRRVGERALENLVFHLGLAEMPSYWKATASPKIIIEAGSLDTAQINWLHDLFMRGMGQYFYENKIDFTKPNFLTIMSKGDAMYEVRPRTSRVKEGIVIPIGGGKDAIVTYEILKRAGWEIRPFVLNPKREQLAILRIAGENNPIIVERTIDPKLLGEVEQKMSELNMA